MGVLGWILLGLLGVGLFFAWAFAVAFSTG